MKSEFEIAITQLCADRNVSPEVILEAIEDALVSAYKRNYGAEQNISVTVDRRTGQARVYVKKAVVPEVQDEQTQMTLAEARTYDPNAKLGDFVDIELKPRNFGRIAAQTAKQVIMQRIREAERDSVYLEYADRVGELANGVVRNIDSRSQAVTIGLGKAEALLPRSEQIPGEYYRFNQRLRVYLVEVERSGHGPQIIASRAHKGLLRRLLELEVPEIYNGTVEIKAIAREAGSRSKVAVAALQPGVDPVGSCVGMRGVRIQNIVNELNGEKIDIVPWSEETEQFIANALSPAKVVSVHLDSENGTAKVVVPDNALSLAIGKEGQNARLAHKLTGWRIDIISETEAAEEAKRLQDEALEAAARAQEREEARRAAAALLAEAEVGLDEEETEELVVGDEPEDMEEVQEAAAADTEVEAAPEAEAIGAVEDDVQRGEEVQEAEKVPGLEELAGEEAALDEVPDAEEPEVEDADTEPAGEEAAPEEFAEDEDLESDIVWAEEPEESLEDLADHSRGRKPRRRKDRPRVPEPDERFKRGRRQGRDRWRWDEDDYIDE